MEGQRNEGLITESRLEGRNMKLECPATIFIEVNDDGRETPAGQRELIKLVAEKIVQRSFMFHIGKLPDIGVRVTLNQAN